MSNYQHEFIVPCSHCRKLAVAELRRRGLRFQLRGKRIFGNGDVYEVMAASFSTFRPALSSPHTQLECKAQ